MQNMYYYYINMLAEKNWFGTKVCSYSYFKNRSFDILRNSKDIGVRIENGGWHFTFLGGVDKIIQKIESWGHKEMNTPHIKSKVLENVENGKDIFYRGGFNITKVDVDDSFPKFLLDNLDKYRHFIKG
jgi:beta-1,4-mannosyl-glycoprotein beta-1,4-N-acetylglucosaminyltransferase